jgi:hypothetical protein
VEVYNVSEVFVPGGLPKYTYVPRRPRKLEEKLGQVNHNLCKIATVTGATKSGKTVLVRKLFDPIPKIWIDGGHVRKEQDFWDNAGAQLVTVSQTAQSITEQESAEIGAETTAEASIVVARAGGKITGKGGHASSSTLTTTFTSYTPWSVVDKLKRSHIAVVVDDFHYLSRNLQGTITRFLKPLVFDGVPVVYLAIPHRRYDAIKVEREMNGRIEVVEVPAWSDVELAEIAQLGFPLVNIVPDINTSLMLAREAQGSPHLMQEFCKDICHKSGIAETSPVPRYIIPDYDYSRIFRTVAENLGKNIFEILARGPRSRTDRLARKLKDGRTADIYRVVLLALAHLKPGVSTIEYETLRSAIRYILDDVLPDAHQVSRVLEQMARISTMDESSTPVIDYEKDERRLHITDPFFAFFLKWGTVIT